MESKETNEDIGTISVKSLKDFNETEILLIEGRAFIEKERCFDMIKDFAEQQVKPLNEEITILTTQRDGYKEQFNEQKRLFDSSQEEVKRLKEEKEAQEFKFGQVTGDQFKKIEELEERVKELTEENQILKSKEI
jgi:predicted  nucleic acid-binding Zn-ribbon protein